MSRLTPIRWRELVRRLRALGRHPFMVRGTLRLRIPNPHGEDIGAGLMARLLRDGGISREEWESIA
jgi:hypothetical protein